MLNPHDIIIKPIVTEKSMSDMEEGKYTFKVDRRINKSEIKKAIENVFGVKVEKVNKARTKVEDQTGKKPLLHLRKIQRELNSLKACQISDRREI